MKTDFMYKNTEILKFKYMFLFTDSFFSQIVSASIKWSAGSKEFEVPHSSVAKL